MTLYTCLYGDIVVWKKRICKKHNEAADSLLFAFLWYIFVAIHHRFVTAQNLHRMNHVIVPQFIVF